MKIIIWILAALAVTGIIAGIVIAGVTDITKVELSRNITKDGDTLEVTYDLKESYSKDTIIQNIVQLEEKKSIVQRQIIIYQQNINNKTSELRNIDTEIEFNKGLLESLNKP